MYKKITHNIVEEHFDHPVAVEMRSKMNYMPQKNSRLTMMNDQAMLQIKLDSRTLFGNFANSVRSLIVSIMDNGLDQKVITDQLFNDIYMLGKVVGNFYGEDAEKQFDDCLKAISLTLADLVSAVKFGKSTTDLKSKLETQIMELAKLLDSANPEFWPEATVISIISKVAEQWLIQAAAREKKDFAADLESSKLVNAIMVTGSPNGVPSFADIFSNGVIQQFPRQFTT